ncbi:RNA-directed DNA polymerase, eukaryota [Tanacetum coccineum]
MSRATTRRHDASPSPPHTTTATISSAIIIITTPSTSSSSYHHHHPTAIVITMPPITTTPSPPQPCHPRCEQETIWGACGLREDNKRVRLVGLAEIDAFGLAKQHREGTPVRGTYSLRAWVLGGKPAERYKFSSCSGGVLHALEVEKADWIVHVTDVGQRDYIDMCITAAKRIGLIADDHSKYPLSHVGFGHVQGNDFERFQIFKTELVSLVNLLDEAKSRCKGLLAGPAGMADEWTAEELEHAAEALGYGAVKYADLKNNRLTNYTFSFDQILNEEGNTAVYPHYTHHQVCSIIRSSNKDIKELTAEELILTNDDERELGLHLLRFTEVLGGACTVLAPHILCEYLYELCKKFNSLLLCKATEVWAIEGDENSNFFHGIINRKRANLAIKGVMVDGEWVDDPCRVKEEFRLQFANRFRAPAANRCKLNYTFPNRLSSDQLDMLESPISRDEVRNAVWGCGENKSPGPDGFTFEFFRKFWDTLGSDFCAAVEWFFDHSSFSRGCNSSFIALIPKNHDPKFVNDYRPISLIGSLYKVVTKILATRLSSIISGLISDVQTAFLPNRQILDGPFIINELLSWCKHKKQQAMVFKVDFAKAYDSIRWDFLEDVLRAFGFGSKWCSWIRGCLHSGMASVLLNGSPTSEFQFHCGLKQGDPLAPYLFILIMESLHLSLSRAIEAGIFKGIKIGSSLNISHLFYADDAVFIGEWSIANLSGITHILHCFSLLSGLSINLKKSHLLGVGIRSEDVNAAALYFGCSTMKTPFKYLGVMVGGNSSTLQAWDDTIGKLKARLSNWKLKTLSVGGRLTLLKSVLGSTPIYNMSIYKVPKSVLQTMESIHRNFFNGVQCDERKNCVDHNMGQGTLLSNMEDRWVWDLNGESVFRVKDVRILLDECFLPKAPIASRWVKYVPIKINVFAWKVFLDRLPTRSNLQHRGVLVSDLLCPLCSSAQEDSYHLFFSCRLVTDIVRLVCRWWNVSWTPLGSYADWLNWFISIRLSSKVKDLLEGVLYIT